MGSFHLLPLTIYGVLFFATLVTATPPPDPDEEAAVPVTVVPIDPPAGFSPGTKPGEGCPDSFEIKADLETEKLVGKTAFILVDYQNGFCEDQGGTLPVPGTGDLAKKIRDEVLSLKFDLVIATKDWHPSGHYSFLSSIQNALEQANPLDSAIPQNDKVAYNIVLQNPTSHKTYPLTYHFLWKDHCVQDTTSADFHPALVQKIKDINATLVYKGVYNTRENLGAFVTSYTYDDFNLSNTNPHNINLYKYLTKLRIKNVVVGGLALSYCVTDTASQASNGDKDDDDAPKASGFRVFVLTDGSGCLTNLDSSERHRACTKLKDNKVKTITIAQLSAALS